MPLDSVICRKNLDESRGNPWVCECPMCKQKRDNGKNSIQENNEGEIDDERRFLHGE